MKVQLIKTSAGIVAAAWQGGLLEGLTLPLGSSTEALTTLAQYLKVTELPEAEEVSNDLQKKLGQDIIRYFDGEAVDFAVPINWNRVTPFQGKVLQAVAAIPYGQVLSYGEIARQVGNPKGARAVGGAVGANPWLLVVP